MSSTKRWVGQHNLPTNRKALRASQMTRRAAYFYQAIHLKINLSFTSAKNKTISAEAKLTYRGINLTISSSGGSMVNRFTIHSTTLPPSIHHLHLIAIATHCYTLLHHRYIVLLTHIIVTCCNSTPLLIDTSL